MMNDIDRRLCFKLPIGFILLLSLVETAIGASASVTSLRANDVLADVRTRGARAVVESLWTNSEQWDTVMRNISHGRSEWLKVAVALHPGTDGGASEMLDEALFLALKPAPIAVLQLLQEHQFQSALVCSSNIGTDYTSEESRRLVEERIKVLMNLSGQMNTLPVRDECLKGLRGALKDLSEP
jgi:hypothetical protein